MTDYFHLLQLERQPWLELETLQKRFLDLSAPFHPDRAHQASSDQRAEAQGRYTLLNAAYQCLRDPTQRLRHLLELERGVQPAAIEAIPAATMQTGWEIGQLCREMDAVLEEKRRAADSPLLQLGCFEQVQQALDRLRETHSKLAQGKETLLKELQTMNAAWQRGAASGAMEQSRRLPLERLEQVYRSLSYLQRWERQLQERMTELTV